MSTEQNKQIVERLYREFFGANNQATADALLAENYIDHGPLPVNGREGLKQLVAGVWQAFPDIHPTIDSVLAEGDKVCVRVTATGTHKGDFMGVPASNNECNWTELHIYRLANGRVVEHWAEMNLLGLMQQIGALPPMQ